MVENKLPDKQNGPLPEPDVPLAQIIKDRAVSMEKTEDGINWITEEIKYKENQLKNKIVEENTSQLYTLLSFPKDNKKPRHVLEIEVEMLKGAKTGKEKSLKIMKELQVEDKKEDENATKPS